jgi:ATP-dependent Clp protease protease subunit
LSKGAKAMQHRDSVGPLEISLVGDLTDNEVELTDKLLGVEPGGECTLYIDSPGGSPYCAVSLMTLILLRGLRVTGIVTGECSSAALWPYAACTRRMVTPYSVLLFHPMKWQSEEHVGLAEAAEWARHFGHLEKEMDHLLAELFGLPAVEMDKWINPGRYVSGRELSDAGLAELIDLRKLKLFESNGAARRRKRVAN